MELKEFLHMEVEGMERGMKRVMDGLTQKDIEWQPSCGCNSIGLILFHIFKSEDGFISGQKKGKKELWDTGKWYTKLGMDIKEDGAHYTVDQVNAFPVPKLEKLFAYGAAVRQQTLDYIDGLKPADLDKKIKMRWGGEMPLAMVLSLIVNHNTGHMGEMSYIRGMKRGMDK
jgi:uncharacterized damage-inducible protein DinB